MPRSNAATYPSRNLPAKSLLAGLAMAAALAFAHPARAMVLVSVRFAPPPLLVYEQPVIPEPGYIWVPGYWAWDGDIDDYYWVPGQWVLPPFAGALWTPGYWGWHDGAYFFHRGYWGPAVGYYGGINYGYGYFGTDYVGGYWDRGVFNYNRACNRIDNRVVNVYNNTTIIHRTVINNTRVSYNGGAGGIAVQPTLQQRENERQRHWDAVPEQRAVVRQAREDRMARYNFNRGQPDRMQWRGVPATQPVQPVQPIQPVSASPRPQPPRHPQPWQEPRERMMSPDRPVPEDRRMVMRPAMPPPPRMEQPMQVHAPPASRPMPVPQQQARPAGNPHRDRREHQEID